MQRYHPLTILRLMYRVQPSHQGLSKRPGKVLHSHPRGPLSLTDWPGNSSTPAHATPFRTVLGLPCCGTLCPATWETETSPLAFPPWRTRQHTGKQPGEGTPASQELKTPLPSCPPLGAPFPPSSCSQQAGPGTRSHAAVLLPGELGGRSELCREKAQPVKMSEMNHRHPVQLGSDVSRLLFCA